MTVDPAPAPLVAGVALLERAIGYARGSLLLVTPQDLPRRTPCRCWDLAALLAHMNDSLRALHEAATGGSVEIESAGCEQEHAVPAVASLRNRACRLLGEWSRLGLDDGVVSVGGRPVPASVVAATGAVEIAVHGWDVAQACGRTRPIPASLGEELLELARLFVTAADRGTDPGARFAPPVRIASAEPGAQLLAFLGRRPVGPTASCA